MAKDSMSMTIAFNPADSAAATRSSIFSLREAAISTSTSSGLLGAGPDHLEIEIHLVERERDVLVRFGFDLQLELVFHLPGRNHDLLGDDSGGRAAPARAP